MRGGGRLCVRGARDVPSLTSAMSTKVTVLDCTTATAVSKLYGVAVLGTSTRFTVPATFWSASRLMTATEMRSRVQSLVRRRWSPLR